MYEAGSVVAGKYRIERQLGTGGMGVVVAATHLQLGTAVALKFLHADLAQNQQVVERFMREARSAAQLRGENVCRVSDVGTSEAGQPFIVMELLTGQDLGTVLKTQGAMTLSSAAEAIMHACIALGEAHSLGFVHRDIKPGNLFWTTRPDGSALIKVLDFGVVKGPEEINFSLTQTSNVVGSPGYMSPEQLKSSKTVDFRSDIWSLGVVLYELVSARKPFHGESITELALRVAMDPVPPLAGGIPGSFESVILRCLEKEPQRRFKDVADLAQSLAPFVGPTRGAELAYAVQRVLRGALVPPTATPPAGLPSTPTTLRGANGVVAGSGIRNKRSIRLPMIMAAGAVVGVGLALITLSGGKNHDKPSAANAPAATTKMDVAAPPAPEPPKPAVVEKKAEPAVENKPEPPKPAAVENKTEPAVEKAREQAKVVEVTKPPEEKKSSKRRSSRKTAKTTTKTTTPTEPTEGLSDSRK